MAKLGKIVVIGNEKGGTGKTTLAVNLAVMRTLAGKDTLLIDTDQQQSAGSWTQLRDETQKDQASVPCLFKTGKALGFEIAKMAERFDTVIVDAGGRIGEELQYAVAVCNTLVVPVKPSAFDLWSMSNMDGMLRRLEEKSGEKVPSLIVLNQVKGRAENNPEAQEVLNVLRTEFAERFKLYEQTIGDRVAYPRAAKDGLAVVELPGSKTDAKAVEEMTSLYRSIFGEKWVIHAKQASRS